MTDQSHYQPRIGVFSATMLIAGSMVGVGIYLIPGGMVRTGGSGTFLLLAWGLATLVTLLGAHAYGELAAAFPRAGGQYVYLRESFGPLAGFLFGWSAFTVVLSGAIASVAVGFAAHLEAFLPFLDDHRFLLGHLHVPAAALPGGIALGPYDLGATPARLCACLVVIVLAGLNALGARIGIWVQNFFTMTKLSSLAALILLGLVAAPARSVELAQPAGLGPALPFLPALLVVQGATLFAADSWNSVTFMAPEIRRPRSTIPLALLVGPCLVLALYFLANLAFLRILGPGGIASAPGDRVGGAALRVILGPPGERAMILAILVSTFGCANGLVMASSRLYQAMAADGLFFAGAARLNRFGAPGVSLGCLAVWSCLLTLMGGFIQLLEFSIFPSLLFYGLTVAGAVVLRIRRPGLERPVRMIAYPLPAVLYLLLVTAILGALLWYRPTFTWPGLVLVALGIPVYLVFRRLRRGSGAR